MLHHRRYWRLQRQRRLSVPTRLVLYPGAALAIGMLFLGSALGFVLASIATLIAAAVVNVELGGDE
jgi:hypothetical protein